MSNQIENLSLSFNEILLNIGLLFDELSTDKTTNLVLPNNIAPTESLNKSIKTFDKNLDDVLIQLNDISLFDKKLKQQKLEREQELLNNNNVTNNEENEVNKNQEQQSQQQPQSQQIPEDSDYGNGNDENILDDINMFLSTVPDGADTNLNGEFNDNIQDLLMENDPYGSNNPNDNYGLNFDLNNDGLDNDDNNNNNNNDNNNNNNGNGNNENMDFDNNIFDEIDSMLNI